MLCGEYLYAFIGANVYALYYHSQLVFGTAIGAGFGIVININIMPFTAGIGCAIGLLIGAVITSHNKNKQDQDEDKDVNM